MPQRPRDRHRRTLGQCRRRPYAYIAVSTCCESVTVEIRQTDEENFNWNYGELTNENRNLQICSDHAGLEYKTKLIAYLLGKGYEVVNYGTDSPDSCDYPDFAHRLGYALYGTDSPDSCDYPDFAHSLGYALDNGEVDAGIALCGTGNGMAITLNHHPSVRAGLAWNQEVAKLVKEHNNANVLVMPARFVSYRMAVMMVRQWLETQFAGGRHQRRIDKIVLH